MLPTLGAITAVAAVLRFARLDWGIRDGMPFPDEAIVWSRPLLEFIQYGIGICSILDTSFAYPPLFGHLAGGAVGVAHVCGLVVDPRANVLAGPFPVARAVCATCNVIAVQLTALMG